MIWSKSKKSKNRSKIHENYRILFFRPILENIGHFWWTRAILGSKKFFHRFQNRILRKSRIFEYIFGAEFARNMASGHVVVSKNRENPKIEFIPFLGPKSRQESIASLRKMIRALQKGVLTIFWWLLRAVWSKNQLFSGILKVFWRFCMVSIIGQRESGLHGCTRIEKNRNCQKWA